MIEQKWRAVNCNEHSIRILNLGFNINMYSLIWILNKRIDFLFSNSYGGWLGRA